ncbi:MAG: glycosyltransferase [Candidatus Saccharimonadales bacterium]
MATGRKLKVAIVHDWLIGGGAERVVQALHEMFPDAPIYTSYATDEWREKLDGKVVTGFLQRWPFPKLRKFVGVFRIWWFGHLDFSDYDLVISSSGNGEAFGIKTSGNTKHICYCHTPTHYYWRHYNQYMKRPGFGTFDPLARVGLKMLLGPLRRWDYKAAQRPDLFVANSTHIQSDIKTYYDRDSVVVHPPIDLERFEQEPVVKRDGFVTIGRLAAAKHVDVLIEACNRLKLPLTVIGNGPDYDRLAKIAGPTITFLGKATNTFVSDAEIPAHLKKAQAFLFASFDDFGIVSAEALASGTPVIAYKAGGALDYVEPGKTGLFFDQQTADSLCEVLQSFDSSAFDPAYIHQFATQFSPENFKQHMHEHIDSLFSSTDKK